MAIKTSRPMICFLLKTILGIPYIEERLRKSNLWIGHGVEDISDKVGDNGDESDD